MITTDLAIFPVSLFFSKAQWREEHSKKLRNKDQS